MSDGVLSRECPAFQLTLSLISPVEVKENHHNTDEEHRLDVPLLWPVLLGEDDLVVVNELGWIAGVELLLQLDRCCGVGDALVIPAPVVPVVIEEAEWSCERFVYSEHFSAVQNMNSEN